MVSNAVQYMRVHVAVTGLSSKQMELVRLTTDCWVLAEPISRTEHRGHAEDCTILPKNIIEIFFSLTPSKRAKMSTFVLKTHSIGILLEWKL